MKKLRILSLLFALMGILLIGVGVAFNASSQLGNDPVGILYDGVRSALGLTPSQLGLVSNGVNLALIGLLILVGRHYVNIGTFLYILPYGIFVDLGTWLYQLLGITGTTGQILAGIVGSLLIYTGVSILIAADVGLDPMTGVVMVLRDKLRTDYKKVKLTFDAFMVLIGALLGGKLGVITLATAITAGPSIQWLSNKLIKLIHIKKNPTA